MFAGMLSIFLRFWNPHFFCMSMKITFPRLVLQPVFYKMIRLSSLRVQTCDDADKSDGKLDGVAESAMKGKLDGKEDGSHDRKLDGAIEGTIDE